MSTKKIQKKLLEEIRQAIKEEGATIHSIASDAKIQYSVLHRFVKGDKSQASSRNIKLETIEKLCECLGLELTKRNS